MEDGADPADPTGPVWVVVVAAGSGRRFGGAKQYERLAGRRVLDWSLDAARAVADGVVLVVAEGASLDEPVDHVVVGGATRSASVRSGLAAVPADAAVVLVHDGARPLASGALFARVVEAVQDGAPAVVPAVTPVDTIRERGGTTLDRDALAAVQTPQGFRADVLLAAHRGEAEASDDAALVEADGHEVRLVEGEAANRKITTPEDLVLAEALVAGRGTEVAP